MFCLPVLYQENLYGLVTSYKKVLKLDIAEYFVAGSWQSWWISNKSSNQCQHTERETVNVCSGSSIIIAATNYTLSIKIQNTFESSLKWYQHN